MWRNLILFFLIVYWPLTNNLKADIQPSTAGRIDSALKYLEQDAKYFAGLKCSRNDEFCWWFLFHIRIGDSGSHSMRKFITQTPISNTGNLTGEGHIFQFPAYAILKGVSLDTELSNGLTLEEYIQNQDWLYKFQTSQDKEPSWYLIGQSLYSDLMPIQTAYNDELACAGSHYLVGLYSAGDKNKFKKYLNLYLKKLHLALQYSPEAVFADPKKADLIMHSFETLCLTGQRELIQEDLFIYNLRFLNYFQAKFNQALKSDYLLEPKKLLAQDENLAYATADMLGHFRYGLKICAEKEYNRLKKF